MYLFVFCFGRRHEALAFKWATSNEKQSCDLTSTFVFGYMSHHPYMQWQSRRIVAQSGLLLDNMYKWITVLLPRIITAARMSPFVPLSFLCILANINAMNGVKKTKTLLPSLHKPIKHSLQKSVQLATLQTVHCLLFKQFWASGDLLEVIQT